MFKHLRSEQLLKNFSVVRQTNRAIRKFYGAHSCPTERPIRRIIDKFRTHVMLLNIKPEARQRTVRFQKSTVVGSVEEDPNISICWRSQKDELCYLTRNLKNVEKCFGLVPYKIQFVQEFKPQDRCLRRTFAK